MGNTHSRERSRNGRGDRWRTEEPWRRQPYDEEQQRARGRYATAGGSYRDYDDDQYPGDDAFEERGGGEWQRYAPGGSWYGREDYGDQYGRNEFSRGRSRRGGEYGDYGRDYGRDYGDTSRGDRGDRGDDRARFERDDRGGMHGGRQRDYEDRFSTGFRASGETGHGESWTGSGPYAGRGPKGYRRSNEQITEEASQRLYRHGQVDASEIDVTCEDGVLTLKGTVPDRRMKRLAEDCVESVFGVDDVANELRVRKSSQESNERDRTTAQQGRKSR